MIILNFDTQHNIKLYDFRLRGLQQLSIGKKIISIRVVQISTTSKKYPRGLYTISDKLLQKGNLWSYLLPVICSVKITPRLSKIHFSLHVKFYMI